MTLDEALHPWIKDTELKLPGITCRDLQLDSRRVEAGDLFIALTGRQCHGRQFIPQALARGAAAVLVEIEEGEFALEQIEGAPVVSVPALSAKLGELAACWYGSPATNLKVIGITGTNGKTSCSQYIAQALSAAGTACGVMGTIGYGLPGQLETASHTTPDVVRVHGLLARLQEQGAAAVAMEVSSHGLEQGRVNGVRFDTAVFTNLSRDHLDYHGTMRAYGDAKRQLFAMPGLRHAVINLDDPFAATLLSGLDPAIEVVTYGLAASRAEVAVETLHLHPDGMQAQVVTPWGRGELQSALLGRFNLSNLLACLAVLCLQGMPLAQALKAIARLEPVPGRMQRLTADDGPQVIIDYAHTPDALENALQAMREHSRGRLWCVFGCGGDRDRGKRPLMGEVASRLADCVVMTDDNPRTEDRESILADIREGLSDGADTWVIPDRAQAIEEAVGRAGIDDLVLIAGKGHEDYQEIDGVRYPFSDIEAARKALRAWTEL